MRIKSRLEMLAPRSFGFPGETASGYLMCDGAAKNEKFSHEINARREIAELDLDAVTDDDLGDIASGLPPLAERALRPPHQARPLRRIPVMPSSA
jgi:hypothetical protein